jgi:acetyl-CoA C-acetyltransferase
MARATRAFIVGAYEHPTRLAGDKSVAQLHAEVARGALADAGLSKQDVDGYLCSRDAPGTGPLSMLEYMNMNVRYTDSTNLGGASYLAHVSHAADAIAAGKCDVALITLAGRPRSEGQGKGPAPRPDHPDQPDLQWEQPFGNAILNSYAMVAARHMYQYGTTSEQLAWIKVAASEHAKYNPNAMIQKPITVAEVLASPVVADPLHRLDACVVSDGGGAIVVAREEIARRLARPLVEVIGTGTSPKTLAAGWFDLTVSGAAKSGAAAFAEACVVPSDIKYASLYDSFTITALIQIEDLGFCAKGEGGRFVADGGLISGIGKLPFNTDGGGLCNNHPQHSGGMTKIIEVVRQLRGEAHPAVQVPGCNLALANAIGGQLGTRHGATTLIFERV